MKQERPARAISLFLIKDSIVKDKNGERIYCKQTALYNKLVDVTVLENSVLRKKTKTEATIFHTVRKGLGEKPFARELLGTLISVEEKQLKNERGENITLKGIRDYDFESGFGAGQTIAEYLRENPEKNNKDNWDSWWDGGFPNWAKYWEKELIKRRENT